MKYSKDWLQNYIQEALPENKIIEDELNAKAFEVEGVEDFSRQDGKIDSIFDIKVLPNRAHDALGHIGMARELCACLGLTFKKDWKDKIGKVKESTKQKNVLELLENIKLENKNLSLAFTNEKVLVEVLDRKACTRFSSIRIDGVVVGESPDFIKQALQSIGQKSINNIVDITNYVQFMLNKPMHAYDARDVDGGFKVRYANDGEKLTTLDDKELELNSKTLVIADGQKVLGLAGIKGGKYSGIKHDTTSVILESANFDPVLIRKTSQKYNLKTDASKRFENGISDTLVIDALYETLRLILKYTTSESVEVKISEVTDVYENKNQDYFIGITESEINSILGANYKQEEIEKSLNRLGFTFEKMNTLDFIKNNVQKVVGAEYKNPATQRDDAPKYFSCSSLVSYLFKGIWIPSLSIDKYVFCEKITEGDVLDFEKLKYGDLVFANTGEGKIRYESVEHMRGTKVDVGVDHVGIYLEDNKILHATKVLGKVVIESAEDFSKNRKIIGVGRVSDDLEKERYIVNMPHERLDIRIKENLVEEIGRIIGYKTLAPTLPSLKSKNVKNFLNKKLHYQNVIRNILLENNFSEVMNYSFVEKGEVSLLKAASDKNKLRTNISDGMLESVQKNLNNMPLLNIDAVRVFEFGNVFDKSGEYNHLCISVDDGKKKSNYSEVIEMLLGEIKKSLELSNLEYEVKNTKPYIIEINFENILNELSENYEDNYIDSKYISNVAKFTPYSDYPFIVRDIAFWLEENSDYLKTNEDKKSDIENIIKENAGDLCINVTKFDEFKKEIDGVNKISLGYRLIYQSFEKTLTDEEVNTQSENVYKKLRELGLEVR